MTKPEDDEIQRAMRTGANGESARLSNASTIRRRVLFSGRVQGVGFRMTTTVLSNRYQVSGFVRNLKGGRVELVAEGTKAEIDSFVSAVQKAMKGYIEQVEVFDEAATGEFREFGVAK